MVNKKKRDLANARIDKKLNGIKQLLRKPTNLTLGQRWADRVTRFAGSWLFIFLVFIYLFIWMAINTMWLIYGKIWDPYPFILLNLTLSCLAALQAPIILMSQNRQVERDRIKAERDYTVNRKAEREINDIQKNLDQIKRLINKKVLRKNNKKKR